MRDYPYSGKHWAWWPAEWQGSSRQNTDKVDDWVITPRELHRQLELGEPLVLVDIRERWEADIVSLPGSRLVPINELGYRAEDEIDPEEEIVLLCHHGVRSMEAALMLWDLGYEKVKSLAGGIARWAIEVDPSLRRY
jgi:adenylyltransferase/sulfurtransferase